jgi:hypothetical protein
MMDAVVTVEFTIRNVFSKEELDDSGLLFEELVRSYIGEEGLLSLCSDGNASVVAIEQV